MNTVKIAHMYYDLGTEYGSNSNIFVIKKYLEDQNINVTIVNYTINDTIDFEEIDMIVMGNVSKFNKELIKTDIIKFKSKLNDYILKGKFVFIGGNLIELFGNELLDFFDYYTIDLDDRLVEEIKYKSIYSNDAIVGLFNQSTNIISHDKPLFVDTTTDDTEGIFHNHFYGTYIIGPILARNPFFAERLIDEFLVYNKFDKINEYKNDLDKKAYNTHIKKEA